jgi:hypothetical protein
MLRARYKSPAKKALAPVKKQSVFLPGDIVVQDCEQLPSADGSNSYLQLFKIAPGVSIPVGERLYFDQNSKIDGCRLTYVMPHFYNDTYFSPAAPIDMWGKYQDDDINYDVIPFNDYKNMLLTLADKLAAQTIERIPAATFLVLPSQPLVLGAGNTPKARKPVNLVISTMRSFIEFTTAFSAGVNGTIIPISFYYENK